LRESKNQIYTLEDPSKGAVQLFTQWLYTQKLDSYQLPEKIANIQKNQYLAELWILADKLLISQLQNVAAREIHAHKQLTRRAPLSLFRYVYENTQEESPLRKLYLNMCASDCPLQNLQTTADYT
jgi:hypothetical protein